MPALPHDLEMGVELFRGASLGGMRRAGQVAARTLAHVGARLVSLTALFHALQLRTA